MMMMNLGCVCVNCEGGEDVDGCGWAVWGVPWM